MWAGLSGDGPRSDTVGQVGRAAVVGGEGVSRRRCGASSALRGGRVRRLGPTSHPIVASVPSYKGARAAGVRTTIEAGTRPVPFGSVRFGLDLAWLGLALLNLCCPWKQRWEPAPHTLHTPHAPHTETTGTLAGSAAGPARVQRITCRNSPRLVAGPTDRLRHEHCRPALHHARGPGHTAAR